MTSLNSYPVRAIQFGGGNFLRAFVDWVLECMNRKGLFNGSVAVVQRRENDVMRAWKQQNGAFHVVCRGVEKGQAVEKIERVSCVKHLFADDNPSDWAQVLDLARSPELRFVFSNTTEAGIEYRSGVRTFPAKVAEILQMRYQSGLSGLIFLPCELIEHNGATLKKCVLAYIEDTAVKAWIERECIFANTLVDRIVSGAPNEDDARRYKALIGYDDALLTCCEPFFFWAIEAPASVADELPLDRVGLDVVFTNDLQPYRTRKVRFLNGAHSASVLGAHLAGFKLVDEMVQDEYFGKFLRQVLFEEVLPTIALPETEKYAYAESVLERFANPFAGHRLSSIALNSVAKWKVRVLPTLLDYVKITGKLPEALTRSMAYLIAFYTSCEVQDSPEVKTFFAGKPGVKTILGQNGFWGMDLNSIPGFTQQVIVELEKITQ